LCSLTTCKKQNIRAINKGGTAKNTKPFAPDKVKFVWGFLIYMTTINKQKQSSDILDREYDIFISYQYTGIEPELRDRNIQKMVDQVEATGKSVFCQNIHGREMKEMNKMTYDEVLAFALEVEEKCKEIYFHIIYPVESTGMKAELEHAVKNKIPGKLIILNELQYLDWVRPFIKYCGDKVEVIQKF
jgi:hypothetical protein